MVDTVDGTGLTALALLRDEPNLAVEDTLLERFAQE